MGSALADRLEALLRQFKSPMEPGIKTALSRLAAETKARLRNGSAESFDFFYSAVRAVAQIKGTAQHSAGIFDFIHAAEVVP